MTNVEPFNKKALKSVKWLEGVYRPNLSAFLGVISEAKFCVTFSADDFFMMVDDGLFCDFVKEDHWLEFVNSEGYQNSEATKFTSNNLLDEGVALLIDSSQERIGVCDVKLGRDFVKQVNPVLSAKNIDPEWAARVYENLFEK